MKENKKNITYLLVVNIFLFIFFYCNQCSCENKIITYKTYDNDYKKKSKPYPYLNKKIIPDHSIIHPLISNYSFSKIQIDNNSLNLINIYFHNNKKLIFNQIGLQFPEEKKIYNFGIGYRNYYCAHWIIGNNIFYDTILSKYGGKILSIGSEFFKNSISVTTNTYYNISINNCIHTSCSKKYIPYAYDIRSIIPLTFFPKIYGKINLEYYLHNQNHHNTILQNINNIKKNNTHSIYKLIFGIRYTPTSIFTFDIDKIILNSIKNYETQFHITVNHKINIPKIYQIKHNNDKYFNQIHLTNYNYSIVNRNNQISLFNNKINDFKKIKTYNLTQDDSKKTELSNNTILEKNQTIDTNNINPNKQLKIKQNNHILNTYDNEKNTNTKNNDSIDLVKHSPDIKNSDSYSLERTQKIYSQNTLIHLQKKELYHSNRNTYNIPPPPPIININSDNNDQNSQKNIPKTINEHKTNKFSSLGSEEHLLKLSSIIKQRKKTISTNDNNDSESIKLLKIIERQSALKINTDTDSDDKESNTSNNEFSDY